MVEPQTKLTWKDYFLLDDDQRCELIEGELVMAPAPDEPHQGILWNLAFAFASYLRAHPIGECRFAPLDVKLTDEDVVQPDLLFVSNERLPLLKRRGMMGAPDLVVEVLSDSTEALDRGKKLDLYRRTGVRECWLVSPAAASVQVFRFAASPDRPVESLDRLATLTSPLLPGLEIALREIFG